MSALSLLTCILTRRSLSNNRRLPFLLETHTQNAKFSQRVPVALRNKKAKSDRVTVINQIFLYL